MLKFIFGKNKVIVFEIIEKINENKYQFLRLSNLVVNKVNL